MPELPEVETTINGLKKKVLKRAFIDVWSDWKKMVKRPADFLLFKNEIKNKKIKNIWRRGKNIIFDLSGGYSLLVHQKMTGHLLYGSWEQNSGKWEPVEKGPLEEKINAFIHIIFFLDNKKMVALSDVRKFAKVELWKTKEMLESKEFKSFGPEPLEKKFTYVKFKQAIQKKKGKVKQVLMDPEAIAGIGNIYSNEALWMSKIYPFRNVSTLKDKELKLLFESIKKVLTLGIKLGGESFSDYRKPDGTKGDFDTERKVYKREGQKCQRCKEKIKRIKMNGRSAFFCPNCQK